MNKISQLISLLGGTGAVAEKLKIKPSAISNWKKLNKIPSTKHKDVLELSSYLDINIENFLPTQKLLSYKLLCLITNWASPPPLPRSKSAISPPPLPRAAADAAKPNFTYTTIA